jgi:hypothetical protein
VADQEVGEPLGQEGQDKEVSDEDRIITSYKERIKNPLTAIRAHCVECMGGAPRWVADCTSPGCSLYGFRMGKNTMHGRYGVSPPKKEE